MIKSDKCASIGCNKPAYPGYHYCSKFCAINQKNKCNREECIFEKNPGFDFCCLSCKNNQLHGSKCTTNTIYFYDKDKPYYELTNFYVRSIIIDGVTYISTEHYYQSQKFMPTYPLIYQLIINQPSPRKALETAKKYNHLVRGDWHKGYKEKIMKIALRAKFSQHIDLKKILLSTNYKYLAEKTTIDKEWGIGSDGTGKNKLGLLLMDLRKSFQTNTKI